jgi:hypothetical protein
VSKKSIYHELFCIQNAIAQKKVTSKLQLLFVCFAQSYRPLQNFVYWGVIFPGQWKNKNWHLEETKTLICWKFIFRNIYKMQSYKVFCYNLECTIYLKNSSYYSIFTL